MQAVHKVLEGSSVTIEASTESEINIHFDNADKLENVEALCNNL